MSFKTTKDAHLGELELQDEPMHLPQEGDWVGFMHKEGQFVQGRVKARCFNFRSSGVPVKVWKEVVFRVDFKRGNVHFSGI
jgi:hypothetical protein